jgi:hypothetical protein
MSLFFNSMSVHKAMLPNPTKVERIAASLVEEERQEK